MKTSKGPPISSLTRKARVLADHFAELPSLTGCNSRRLPPFDSPRSRGLAHGRPASRCGGPTRRSEARPAGPRSRAACRSVHRSPVRSTKSVYVGSTSICALGPFNTATVPSGSGLACRQPVQLIYFEECATSAVAGERPIERRSPAMMRALAEGRSADLMLLARRRHLPAAYALRPGTSLDSGPCTSPPSLRCHSPQLPSSQLSDVISRARRS